MKILLGKKRKSIIGKSGIFQFCPPHLFCIFRHYHSKGIPLVLDFRKTVQ